MTPQSVYCLNTKLRIGDIVLLRTMSLFSGVIAFASGGRFSHAMLYLGDQTFMEAMPHGTSRISIYRVFVADRDNIKVMRLVARDTEDLAAVAAKAAELASRHETYKYAFLSAAMSIFSSGQSDAVDDPDSVFCSQLVARSYRLAASPLFGDDRKVTPNALADSPLLEDLTDELTVVQEYNSQSERKPLDSPDAVRPIKVQSAALGKLLSESNKILRSRGIREAKGVYDLFRWLSAWENRTEATEVDKQISELLAIHCPLNLMLEGLESAEEEALRIGSAVSRFLSSSSTSRTEVAFELNAVELVLQSALQTRAVFDECRGYAMQFLQATGFRSFFWLSMLYNHLAQRSAATTRALANAANNLRQGLSSAP